jgi:hypothetical protein
MFSLVADKHLNSEFQVNETTPLLSLYPLQPAAQSPSILNYRTSAVGLLYHFKRTA